MDRPNSFKDIVWPAVFLICIGWIFWYLPRIFVSLGWASDALTLRFGPAHAIDWLMLAGALAALVVGVAVAGTGTGEGEVETPFDKLSLFLGRATMLLIVVLVCVMFYEVVLRYVFESPTLWANELSLWIAGFVFLFAGLYAMQQRSHIRIYLLYDVMPRALQRACDVVSTLLILVFSLAMIWGGTTEASQKLMRWETFGTAFDPPLPATLKPMILLIIFLVALQALANLIADWNKGPVHHSPVDQDELEGMIYTVEHRQHQTGTRD